MATQLRLRRGNTSQISAFTGLQAEVIVNTDTNSLVVHDGTTVGGWPTASLSQSQASFTRANNAFLAANSGASFANGAFEKANASYESQNTTAAFANAAFVTANAAFAAANNVAPQIQPAFNTANGAFAQANAAFNAANNATDTWVRNQANNAYDKANSGATFANGAFVTANSGASFANASFVTSNSAASFANAAFVTANSGATFANGAFVTANSAASFANAAFVTANAAFTAANNATDPWVRSQANNAYDKANSGASFANASFATANAAFDTANLKFNTSGGTISGDVNITGNLSVVGNNFITSATQIVANDTLFVMGIGNYTGDVLDIGFAAHYNNGTNAHTGLIRDASVDEWYLFEGYVPEIGANNNIDINHASFSLATLNANLKSTTITLKGIDLLPYVNNAYNTANSGASFANGSFTTANSAASFANGAFEKANSGATFANASFVAANSSYSAQNTTASFANSAFDRANAAYNAANTAAGGSAVDTYISLTMTGTITVPYTGTSRFYPPKAMTLSVVYANLSAAATGGNFTYIIKKNGTSIGNTFTITQNQTVMSPANISVSLATTDYLTLDVTGASATDLFVRIKYT